MHGYHWYHCVQGSTALAGAGVTIQESRHMVVLLSLDILLTILQGAGDQALAIKSEATGILGESKVPPHHMETPWGLQAWFSTRVAQGCSPALLNTLIFTQHIFNPALPVAPGVSSNHLTNPLPSIEPGICWPILCPGTTGLSVYLAWECSSN